MSHTNCQNLVVEQCVVGNTWPTLSRKARIQVFRERNHDFGTVNSGSPIPPNPGLDASWCDFCQTFQSKEQLLDTICSFHTNMEVFSKFWVPWMEVLIAFNWAGGSETNSESEWRYRSCPSSSSIQPHLLLPADAVASRLLRSVPLACRRPSQSRSQALSGPVPERKGKLSENRIQVQEAFFLPAQLMYCS